MQSQNKNQIQNDSGDIKTKKDPVIAQFEKLLADLQNIFLDIYSNYRRVDD